MMKNKGGNMTTVKYRNRALILNLLKTTGALSRVDIADALELTPAAITILVNDMVKEGIIHEVGQLEEEDKRSGRKKILIDIDYNWKHVIGINIESDSINMGISNIKGELVARKTMPTDKTLTPEQLLEQIASECMNLLWKENIMKEHVLGIGVGVVGRVDEKSGISEHAYGLWNAKVKIKELLESNLGLRVVVDNNVRALALGEFDYHSKDELESLLFIKYGPGIGGALIINNEIYYGHNNSAGEIGHTIIDPNGELCRCGNRGCLETIASQGMILKSIQKEFAKDSTPMLYELCEGDSERVSIEQVCKASELGDTLVQNTIQRAVASISLSIANAVSLYDPNKVIFYGEIFKNQNILNEFKNAMEGIQINRRFEELTGISSLNYKSNYVGGVALALREFFYNCGGELQSLGDQEDLS